MINVEIINNGSQVRFHKKLWDESEVVLARCFNFDVDIDNNIVIANVANTNKQSLYDFIRIAFKSFSESITQERHRNEFYRQMELIYQSFDNYVADAIRQKLPYADKFYLHQHDGVRFSYYNRCNFLAYEMRTGKSIVAASISRLFNVKRTLILCPNVAKYGWFRDLTGFWGFNELYFTMLDAAKSKTFRAFHERFVICNFDILTKFKPQLLAEEFGHIIIDEAHRCKNRNSKRFHAVEEIVQAFHSARITMLSGTAIPNRFDDLFAYFKLTGHYLGQSYKKFIDEFTIKTNTRGGEKVTGAKNIADLKLKMSNFMIVRTMDECFDMPEDVVSRYTFQMDDYRPEYDKIIKEMSETKDLASLHGHIHSLNLITCKSKIPGIIKALEEIIAETGKVVVFGTYKEPLQMLEDYFKERCLKVVGGVSAYNRDQYKQRFHSDPKIEVFLANYEAGGEALDLSVANDFFTINFPLSPRELNQAKFRLKHPEKKGKHLRIHHTFCENSVDEHIYENIILDKQRDINKLLHDGKDVVEQHNMTELLISKILNRKDDFTNNLPQATNQAETPSADMEAQPTTQRQDTQVYGSETTDAGHVLPRSESADNAGSKAFDNSEGSDSGILQKPKYYLIAHGESDCLFILNEDENKGFGSGDGFCAEIFYHEDIDEVIKVGREQAPILKLEFSEAYNPNGNITAMAMNHATGEMFNYVNGKLVPHIDHPHLYKKPTFGSKILMIDQESIETPPLKINPLIPPTFL